MDYKKSKAPINTVSRNIMDLCRDTGNIYESVAIIAKRANQISVQIKEDLSKKLGNCRSLRCWLRRSSSRTRSTGVTPPVRIRRTTSNPVSPCGSVNRPFSSWRPSS